MDNNNANRQQQGGTGSAEQTNLDRKEQKATSADISENEKSDIASQIGESKGDVRTISDLGGLSGRDDSAGGTGDRMERESTNEATDTP